MSLDAVIFDFGGTLDTGGDHWYCVMADAYRACGLHLSREDYINGERLAAAEVSPQMGLADTLAVKLRGQRCPSPGAVGAALVDLAHARAAGSADRLAMLSGRVPLALVSNYYGNLDRVTDELGLRRYFDLTVDSACVGIRKPDPAIFRLAIDRLGAASGRTAVVGDSIAADLVPASTLGCITARVAGRPWPWSGTDPVEFRPDYNGTLAETVDALLTLVNH